MPKESKAKHKYAEQKTVSEPDLRLAHRQMQVAVYLLRLLYDHPFAAFLGLTKTGETYTPVDLNADVEKVTTLLNSLTAEEKEQIVSNYKLTEKKQDESQTTKRSWVTRVIFGSKSKKSSVSKFRYRFENKPDNVSIGIFLKRDFKPLSHENGHSFPKIYERLKARYPSIRKQNPLPKWDTKSDSKAPTIDLSGFTTLYDLASAEGAVTLFQGGGSQRTDSVTWLNERVIKIATIQQQITSIIDKVENKNKKADLKASIARICTVGQHLKTCSDILGDLSIVLGFVTEIVRNQKILDQYPNWREHSHAVNTKYNADLEKEANKTVQEMVKLEQQSSLTEKETFRLKMMREKAEMLADQPATLQQVAEYIEKKEGILPGFLPNSDVGMLPLYLNRLFGKIYSLIESTGMYRKGHGQTLMQANVACLDPTEDDVYAVAEFVLHSDVRGLSPFTQDIMVDDIGEYGIVSFREREPLRRLDSKFAASTSNSGSSVVASPKINAAQHFPGQVEDDSDDGLSVRDIECQLTEMPEADPISQDSRSDSSKLTESQRLLMEIPLGEKPEESKPNSPSSATVRPAIFLRQRSEKKLDKARGILDQKSLQEWFNRDEECQPLVDALRTACKNNLKNLWSLGFNDEGGNFIKNTLLPTLEEKRDNKTVDNMLLITDFCEAYQAGAETKLANNCWDSFRQCINTLLGFFGIKLKTKANVKTAFDDILNDDKHAELIPMRTPKAR